MRGRIHPKLRVVQKAVGFRAYQIDFINENPLFDFNKLIRDKLDEQIKLQSPEWWEKVKSETAIE